MQRLLRSCGDELLKGVPCSPSGQSAGKLLQVIPHGGLPCKPTSTQTSMIIQRGCLG